MNLHRVIHNEGAQTVRHVPLDKHARPTRVTGATYEIFRFSEDSDSSDRTLVAQTPAVMESVNQVLQCDAGPSQANPKIMDVESASAYTVGRTYLITQDGRGEAFICDRVDNINNEAYSRYELSRDYKAVLSSVQAIELEASFPSSEANDSDVLDEGDGLNYIVMWRYTIDNVDFRVPEQIELTRYSVAPFINEADVLLSYPTMSARARGRVTIKDAIQVATHDFVAMVEAAGKNPSYFRASNAALWAVRERAIEYLLRWMGTDADTEDADRRSDMFMKHMGDLLTGRPPHGTVQIRRDSDTATQGTDRSYGRPIFRKS